MKKNQWEYSKTAMYCLAHEQWGHFLCDDLDGEQCLWVTSAPPEPPDGWELTVTEPSPEELKRMDLNAEELLMDAIGAGL